MVEYRVFIDDNFGNITVKTKLKSCNTITLFEHIITKKITTYIKEVIKESGTLLLQVDNGDDALFEKLKKELIRS